MPQNLPDPCVIKSGCDHFITTDDRILKYETDRIKIATPIQFLMENEVM